MEDRGMHLRGEMKNNNAAEMARELAWEENGRTSVGGSMHEYFNDGFDAGASFAQAQTEAVVKKEREQIYNSLLHVYGSGSIRAFEKYFEKEFEVEIHQRYQAEIAKGERKWIEKS